MTNFNITLFRHRKHDSFFKLYPDYLDYLLSPTHLTFDLNIYCNDFSKEVQYTVLYDQPVTVKQCKKQMWMLKLKTKFNYELKHSLSELMSGISSAVIVIEHDSPPSCPLTIQG